MLTNSEFLSWLRDALEHLYEPDRLQDNPLATLFGVANRPNTYIALQDILLEAIDSLRPDPHEPPESAAWLVYAPLYHRYVQQLNQRQVARQLGVSVRHLRRKEHAALQVLAGRLWNQFNLDNKLRDEGKELGRPAEVEGPRIDDELAWLRETPPERPANLNQVLRDVLDLARPLVAHHGVSLDISVAPSLPELAVHSLALSQALLNLLSAAICEARGGRVAITISLTPSRSSVDIRISVPEPPSAARPAGSDRTACLRMADQLASLCGGELRLAGQSQGFDATLTIPVLGQLPVLVIDDNLDTLQLLRRYATGTPYRLITVRDPQDALAMIQTVSPRIIVLDVMMPRVDGWKVLMHIRQHPQAAETPILVCTVLPQEELALSIGATGFLRKPVTRDAFLSALDKQVRLMALGSH